MRFVHILISASLRESVLDYLDGENIDSVVTEETSGNEDRVQISLPLPTEAVDSVLEALRQIGGEDLFVVISNAESATTPRVSDLEERVTDADETDNRIADDEIRATALEMNPRRKVYYSMTVLSVIVAAVGLLLDAPAIVVGSMVIAPQVSSALTAEYRYRVQRPFDGRWQHHVTADRAHSCHPVRRRIRTPDKDRTVRPTSAQRFDCRTGK